MGQRGKSCFELSARGSGVSTEAVKRIVAAIGACLIAGASLAVEPELECRPQKAAKNAVLEFPRGSVTVDVVDTPQTRAIGLMCRRKIPREYGMLFVFPNETYLNFWMKNTLASLDLIWIGEDRRITTIKRRLPPSRLDTPEADIARAGGRGQFVLELAAGEADRRGLAVGDRVNFAVAIPPL